MSNSRMYRAGALVDQDFPAHEVGARLSADDQVIIWLDLCRPNERELALLADELDIHALAVEDIVHRAQRAKLDRYETHMFLNTYVLRLDADGELADDELSAFIKPRLLVTVRYNDRLDIRQLLARWDDSAELARHGIAFLLYGLLDMLVDGHFSALQQLDTTLEKVQSAMFGRGEGVPDRNEVQRRIFTARRDLVRLRQVTLPMREVVNALMRPTMHTVDPEMIPYYQDLYDHVLRVIERSDSIRDLDTTMLETNLMLQNNQLNLIVKQVTAWAAVIAVPTAVTGFFGQNLAFPWRHTVVEFVVSLVVAVGLAIALYVFFRRKNWI